MEHSAYVEGATVVLVHGPFGAIGDDRLRS